MAASITATATNLGGGITKYTLAWTSHTDGTVASIDTPLKRGELFQARIVPGSGGTQPSDNYDLTLLDESGADHSGGIGTDLDNATATIHRPAVGTYWHPWLEGGDYQLTVANAGDSKTGTVILYVRD